MYTCPKCGKIYDAPPKWCNCTPYPHNPAIDEDVRYYLIQINQNDIPSLSTAVNGIDDVVYLECFEISSMDDTKWDLAAEFPTNEPVKLMMIRETYYTGIETATQFNLEWKELDQDTFQSLKDVSKRT